MQGSLNRMRLMLDGPLEKVDDVMLLNPLSVTRWLCHYPVRARSGSGYSMADDAMTKRVAALSHAL